MGSIYCNKISSFSIKLMGEETILLKGGEQILNFFELCRLLVDVRFLGPVYSRATPFKIFQLPSLGGSVLKL